MKTKKTWIIISAVIAVVAITLSVSFAAWDASKASKDLSVVSGSNADMKMTYTAANDNKLLVPKDQIGLNAPNTNKTILKDLGTIALELNGDAEGNDLAVVYEVSAIYAVKSDYKGTIADIKKMSADDKTAGGVVDLSIKHDIKDEGGTITASNPRFVTGATDCIDSTTSKAKTGTDLRLNVKIGDKNYAAGDEMAFTFDSTAQVFKISDVKVSLEFTRTANEEFVTMNDFLGKKIMIELTVNLKNKTVTQA